jgi:hypothetical protein
MGANGKSPYVEVAYSLVCATSGESAIRMVPACDYEVAVSMSASQHLKDRRSRRLLTRVVCCLSDSQYSLVRSL